MTLGKVGLSLDTHWFAPANPDNPDDVSAAERAQQFRLGWFANPVFNDGDYPQVMKDQLERKMQEKVRGVGLILNKWLIIG